MGKGNGSPVGFGRRGFRHRPKPRAAPEHILVGKCGPKPGKGPPTFFSQSYCRPVPRRRRRPGRPVADPDVPPRLSPRPRTRASGPPERRRSVRPSLVARICGNWDTSLFPPWRRPVGPPEAFCKMVGIQWTRKPTSHFLLNRRACFAATTCSGPPSRTAGPPWQATRTEGPFL